MMNRKFLSKKSIPLVLLIAALCAVPLAALEVPAWSGPVNDLAQVMSPQQEQELTDYLTNLNNQTGIQMAVLTVPSLEGDSIEDFSFRTASAWKLGQEKEDNGALLVVSEGDRELRIEVGYGLEGVLTDAKSGLIIRNVITPHFRTGDYGTGIVEGIKNMVGVATADAELVSSDLEEDEGVDSRSLIVSVVFFTLYFAILSMAISKAIKYGRGRKKGSAGKTNSASGAGSYVPPIFFGGGPSSSSRNSFGGGGGFSGGGGSFGGGGASGKW